ncbi:MAG TPA: hypothetical protein VJJ28_01665 [Candidatus Paceibacterota bacterium]
MIYFYHGTDKEKVRVKSHELIDLLKKKKPDVSFFRIDIENFNQNLVEQCIGGQGLFISKSIVLLDRLCEKKEVKEQFLENISEIAESDNIFIILEGKLDKVSISKIEKKAEKSVKFDMIEKSNKEEFNTFALADALGRKDRKNAWVLYRKAIDKGEAPEALHGMLFWKVKTMILNSSFGLYKKEELYGLADKLITIYHDSRRGMHELETGVEGVILEV